MNNENLELQITYSRIIKISWFITIAVSVIFLVLGIVINHNDYWYSWVISYLLGAMTNFFAFNLLKNNVANLSGDTKKEITSSFSNYFIRFAIYGGVLFICFNNEKLNPYVAVTGLVTIRIAIYIYTYLEKKKKGGN